VALAAPAELVTATATNLQMFRRRVAFDRLIASWRVCSGTGQTDQPGI
jgi:hypothetical protein